MIFFSPCTSAQLKVEEPLKREVGEVGGNCDLVPTNLAEDTGIQSQRSEMNKQNPWPRKIWKFQFHPYLNSFITNSSHVKISFLSFIPYLEVLWQGNKEIMQTRRKAGKQTRRVTSIIGQFFCTIHEGAVIRVWGSGFNPWKLAICFIFRATTKVFT